MDQPTAIDHSAYRERTADFAASTTESTEHVREVAGTVSRPGACFETFGKQGEQAWV